MEETIQELRNNVNQIQQRLNIYESTPTVVPLFPSAVLPVLAPAVPAPPKSNDTTRIWQYMGKKWWLYGNPPFLKINIIENNVNNKNTI